MRKELSDSAKGTTNDTELNEPNKDLKDNKESYDEQNTNIENSLNTRNLEKDWLKEHENENITKSSKHNNRPLSC
ncbi:hypothetical protein B795N_22220 [Marinilactibacillus psychrotolerans]|uniref:hypothetical protein n=1 Tax=Marinilactibacillus psychrotolerans TaxID=191770 RepID=UPI001C7CB4E1|nr:hypothetical protein [Marinilactibacillus psychrotolerans]GEQ34340.1 hypothetical protein B795N_22220 [Marinilactibacillus psychrotolerans]